MESNLGANRISEADFVSGIVDPQEQLLGSCGVTGLSLVHADCEIRTPLPVPHPALRRSSASRTYWRTHRIPIALRRAHQADQP